MFSSTRYHSIALPDSSRSLSCLTRQWEPHCVRLKNALEQRPGFWPSLPFQHWAKRYTSGWCSPCGDKPCTKPTRSYVTRSQARSLPHHLPCQHTTHLSHHPRGDIAHGHLRHNARVRLGRAIQPADHGRPLLTRHGLGQHGLHCWHPSVPPVSGLLRRVPPVACTAPTNLVCSLGRFSHRGAAERF